MTKYETYKRLMETVSDEYGFIEWHECDSLLFSGLVGSCEGVNVNVDAAYDKKKNEWHRRPLKYGCCYDPDRPENKAGLLSRLFNILSFKLSNPSMPMEDIIKPHWYKGSTISRDMLVGLAYYAYYNNRLDISEGIIKKALSSFGVMGRGDPVRINIMPPLLSTFAWISYRLGGPSRPWLRMFSPGANKTKGFEAHLQLLHILLRKELEKKPLKKYDKILKYHAVREKNNPLFRYAVGDHTGAARILKDWVLWPEGRLPTSLDRHEPWLLQRDYGSDWIRGNPGKIHSGGDYVFMYSLLNGKMKK